MFIVSLDYLASSLNSLVITSRHNSLTSVTRSPHFFNSLIHLSPHFFNSLISLFACRPKVPHPWQSALGWVGLPNRTPRAVSHRLRQGLGPRVTQTLTCQRGRTGSPSDTDAASLDVLGLRATQTLVLSGDVHCTGSQSDKKRCQRGRTESQKNTKTLAS